MRRGLDSKVAFSQLLWLLLLGALLMHQQVVLSQTATSLPPLSGAIGAWGDYDNDGLMDVVLGGTIQGVAGIPDGRFTRIYHNEGGLFRDIGAPLPRLDNLSAAWGDFDNDGDLDLLICGMADGANGPVPVIELHRNDGS